MSQQQKKPSTSHAFAGVLEISFLIMMCLSVLTACGSTLENTVSQVPTKGVAAIAMATTTASAIVTVQLTNTPLPLATMLRTQIPGTQAPTRVVRTRTRELQPTLAPGDSKSAFDTRVAQNISARWTAQAMTPSSTPGSPTATRTPAATATETLGWLSACGGAENSHVDQFDSCWQLMRNGHLYSVSAGRHGNGDDMGQGLINIMEFGADNRFHDIGTYLTPSRQGAVEIASVDGTRVYLIHAIRPQPPGANVTPVPNFVFVFDLATLQWVSP